MSFSLMDPRGYVAKARANPYRKEDVPAGFGESFGSEFWDSEVEHNPTPDRDFRLPTRMDNLEKLAETTGDLSFLPGARVVDGHIQQLGLSGALDRDTTPIAAVDRIYRERADEAIRELGPEAGILTLDEQEEQLKEAMVKRLDSLDTTRERQDGLLAAAGGFLGMMAAAVTEPMDILVGAASAGTGGMIFSQSIKFMGRNVPLWMLRAGMGGVENAVSEVVSVNKMGPFFESLGIEREQLGAIETGVRGFVAGVAIERAFAVAGYALSRGYRQMVARGDIDSKGPALAAAEALETLEVQRENVAQAERPGGAEVYEGARAEAEADVEAGLMPDVDTRVQEGQPVNEEPGDIRRWIDVGVGDERQAFQLRSTLETLSDEDIDLLAHDYELINPDIETRNDVINELMKIAHNPDAKPGRVGEQVPSPSDTPRTVRERVGQLVGGLEDQKGSTARGEVKLRAALEVAGDKLTAIEKGTLGQGGNSPGKGETYASVIAAGGGIRRGQDLDAIVGKKVKDLDPTIKRLRSKIGVKTKTLDEWAAEFSDDGVNSAQDLVDRLTNPDPRKRTIPSMYNDSKLGKAEKLVAELKEDIDLEARGLEDTARAVREETQELMARAGGDENMELAALDRAEQEMDAAEAGTLLDPDEAEPGRFPTEEYVPDAAERVAQPSEGQAEINSMRDAADVALNELTPANRARAEVVDFPADDGTRPVGKLNEMMDKQQSRLDTTKELVACASGKLAAMAARVVGKK